MNIVLLDSFIFTRIHLPSGWVVSVGLHLPQLRNASMDYKLSTQCSELLLGKKKAKTNKQIKPKNPLHLLQRGIE